MRFRRLVFDSKNVEKQFRAHQNREHGAIHPLRFYFSTPTCRICLTQFSHLPGMLQHLKAGKVLGHEKRRETVLPGTPTQHKPFFCSFENLYYRYIPDTDSGNIWIMAYPTFYTLHSLTPHHLSFLFQPLFRDYYKVHVYKANTQQYLRCIPLVCKISHLLWQLITRTALH